MSSLEDEAKKFVANKKKSAKLSQADKDRLLMISAAVLGNYLSSNKVVEGHIPDILEASNKWAERLLEYHNERYK